MTNNREEINLLFEEIRILFLHLKEHANLRGDVLRLNPSCELCRRYFGDRLGINAASAA